MVDFEKHGIISKLLKFFPIKIYAITLSHPESCTLEIEACFFYRDDAENALEWLYKNGNKDDCASYEIKETRLTKWKAK